MFVSFFIYYVELERPNGATKQAQLFDNENIRNWYTKIEIGTESVAKLYRKNNK